MKLNDLNNKNISIQVNEPWDWEYGILKGRIIEISDTKLIVALTKSIRGNSFESSRLTLSARYTGDSLSTLMKQNKLTVGGALIEEKTNKTDYILIGTLIL